MTSPTNLSVLVWRSASGAFQPFDVPAREHQTVLDVVTWIQENADPTLTYRFACRVGMCGSCAMMVNETPRWTCRTHVQRVLEGNELRLAPLKNLPVIKDLAADLAPFFDKWTGAGGRHVATLGRNDDIPVIDPATPARANVDAGIECINCAVCYAACDTVAGNPDYLGPAALQRAWTLVNDEKHGNRQGVQAAVSGGDGCFNCHAMGNCTAHCPNDLDPMAAIAGLRRRVVRRALTGGKR